MGDHLDLSTHQPAATPETSTQGKLFVRRALAGSRDSLRGGGPPTRTINGEWMWRTTHDLPEAMQLRLEALAEERGVTEDQIVREALVAFGIGDASQVEGVQDGTHSDDAHRAALRAERRDMLARMIEQAPTSLEAKSR